jgi:hypothetical protein
MSEIDEFDEFPAPDEGEDQFKKMRARANAAARLEKENADLRAGNATLTRQIAFASAGLALTDKQQAALLAAHGDAEMTADALKATAIELKFIEPDEPDEQTAAREAALAGQARIAAAHQGAVPPAPVPPVKERIAQAEADGDWATASLLKAQQVAALARQGQTVQIA